MFKIANGAADDLLTLAILNYNGPVCIAPNMNPLMWNSHSVQRNIKHLKEDGIHFLNVPAHSIEASSGNIVFSEASLPQPQELIESLNAIYNFEKIELIFIYGTSYFYDMFYRQTIYILRF